VSTEDLRTQEALTRQINAQLGMINETLSQQFTIQRLINNAAAETNRTAADVARQAGADLQSAGIQIAAVNNATANANNTIVGGQQTRANSMADLTDLAGGAAAAAVNVGESWDNTAQTIHNAIRGTLSISLGNLQKEFGGLMGEDGLESGTNQVVNRFREINVAVNEQLRATDEAYKIQGASLLSIFGHDINNTLGAYNVMAEKAINMMAGMRGGSAELAINMGLLGKGLGLTNEETATIVQRQISLTGEAGTDMLRNVAAVSKAIEKETGVSAKMVGESIAGIIKDTKNFGNVTEQEAGRISATLFELGLDYGDLGNVVGKFQSFDQAAQGVSALTTVFGVHMDAMDLMRMANEDQDDMLHSIRESFLAAGRSADTLSLAEKRLIQEQLGLGDIESVERLLDPTKTITSMADLSAATSEIPEDMRVVLDSLSEDIVDFGKVTDFQSERVGQFIRDGVKAPLEESLIAMEQLAVRGGREILGDIGSAQSTALSDMSSSLSSIAEMDEGVLDNLNTRLRTLIESLTEFSGGIDMNAFTADMERIGGVLDRLDIGEGISSGISEAVQKIEEAFETMASNIVTTLREHEIIRDETPHTLLETAAEQGAAATERMGTDMVASVASAGDNMNRIQDENNERRQREYARTTEFVSTAWARMSSNMTEDSVEAFEKISAVSNESLTEQLTDASSVYSRYAHELGSLGLTYSTMSDEQKEFMRENLKLGEDYEQQIQSIMGSEEAQRGRRQASQGDFVTDMLETYSGLSEEQQAALAGNEDFMQNLSENYNIDADTFSSMMSGETGDIGSIVAERLRMKNERRVAEAATEATNEGSSESSESVSRNSREQTAALNTLNRRLASNTSELTRIKTAINTMSDKLDREQNVILTVDGTSIADAVINHPSGTPNSAGTVVTQR